MKALKTASAYIVAAVFVLAGLAKLGDISAFSDAVAAFGILPLFAVNIFAMVLPWVEILSGVCVFAPRWRNEGLLLTVALNVIFIIAAGVAMAKGINTDCSCFGFMSRFEKVGLGLIIRDCVFIALALFGVDYESISNRRVRISGD